MRDFQCNLTLANVDSKTEEKTQNINAIRKEIVISVHHLLFLFY